MLLQAERGLTPEMPCNCIISFVVYSIYWFFSQKKKNNFILFLLFIWIKKNIKKFFSSLSFSQNYKTYGIAGIIVIITIIVHIISWSDSSSNKINIATLFGGSVAVASATATATTASTVNKLFAATAVVVVVVVKILSAVQQNWATIKLGHAPTETYRWLYTEWIILLGNYNFKLIFDNMFFNTSRGTYAGGETHTQRSAFNRWTQRFSVGELVFFSVFRYSFAIKFKFRKIKRAKMDNICLSVWFARSPCLTRLQVLKTYRAALI